MTRRPHPHVVPIGVCLAVWLFGPAHAFAQSPSDTEASPPADVELQSTDTAVGIPLTLSQALLRAGDQSEFFDRTRYQEDTAQALREAECSVLWPRLIATGQMVRNDSEVTLGSSTVVNLVDFSGRIQLSADLFSGGDIPRCRSASISARVARQDRIVFERARLFEIAQAYITVLAAQRQLEIAESAYELRQDEFDAMRARREAELVLQSDVSRAALERSVAEQGIVDARVTVADAMDAIALLLGDPQGTWYDLEIPELPQLEPTEETPDQVAARLAVEADEVRHAAAYWDLLPTLSLVAVANFGRASFRDPDGISWAITLALTWTIFDGGGRYADMHLTAAETGISITERIGVDRTLDFETARADRRVTAAFERFNLSKDTEELARQTYDDVRALFERGLATGLEQNTALSDWITSQNNLLIDRLELALARLELAYVSGALWSGGLASVR